MNVLILAVENTNRNQFRYAAIELEQDYCDLVAERAGVYKQMASLLPNGLGQVETRYHDHSPMWCEHTDLFDPETLDDLGVLAEDTLDRGMVVIPAGAFHAQHLPSLLGKMVFNMAGVYWEVYNSLGETEQTVPVNPSYLVGNGTK